MNLTEAIGWASSVVLLLTIGRQIHKQWRAGTSEGVSLWLFAGQLTASLGFTIYSWLVKNWVFVATNALMVVNGLVGLWLTRRQKAEEHEEPDASRSVQ
jgi:MtN3 and saliva related transmembrane protein